VCHFGNPALGGAGRAGRQWKLTVKKRVKDLSNAFCDSIKYDDLAVIVNLMVKPKIAKFDERQTPATNGLVLDQHLVADHVLT